MNNERIRREAYPKLLKFMASGTTGIEAINAELGRCFRGVTRVRASALRLELRIFQIAKIKSS